MIPHGLPPRLSFNPNAAAIYFLDVFAEKAGRG